MNTEGFRPPRALVFAIALLVPALAGCASEEPPAPSQGGDDGPRSDEVQVTVPPGRGGVEYKVHMEQGGRLQYEWSAGAALFFDFHGERDDNPRSAASHKTGDSPTDAGVFTAPFTGRHGWYWQNDTGNAVTVFLEMEGDYTLVGVVGEH